MPSAFDKRFASSSFPRLKGHFGEPVIYYPLAGGTLSIDAIVERDPPAFYDAAGNVVLPSFTIRIDNNCKTGRLASDVNTGGDEVDLIAEIGDSKPTRTTVLKIMSQDSGVVVLALK